MKSGENFVALRADSKAEKRNVLRVLSLIFKVKQILRYLGEGAKRGFAVMIALGQVMSYDWLRQVMICLRQSLKLDGNHIITFAERTHNVCVSKFITMSKANLITHKASIREGGGFCEAKDGGRVR